MHNNRPAVSVTSFHASSLFRFDLPQLVDLVVWLQVPDADHPRVVDLCVAYAGCTSKQGKRVRHGAGVGVTSMEVAVVLLHELRDDHELFAELKYSAALE